MTDSGERAYAYAKASGLLGKSFIAARISRLLPLNRLTELDRLVFPEAPEDLPERQLSSRFERRLLARSAERILKIVDSFAAPPPFLVRLLRVYEYADVKACLAALADKREKAPAVTNLGIHGTVHFNAYPDWPVMAAGSEFAAFQGPFAPEALNDIEIALDRQYYDRLWADLVSLPLGERSACEALIVEEIALKNAITVLRLRSYYRTADDGIEERLINPAPVKPALTAAARQCRGLALDRYSDWKTWTYKQLLNPELPGEFWTIDPRHVQNAAARRLYKKALSRFRFRPFGLDSLAAFIKLLQYEEDLLTSVAEGLTLGVAVKDVYSALGVSA